MSRQPLLAAMALASLSACHAEFEIQPYELPNDQGYRHIAAMIHGQELVMFGGLGNGGPFPPTPMNHAVYTLNLGDPGHEREWEHRSTDTVVTSPWFTSTNGFIELGDSHYLACADTDDDSIYSFDASTYQFTHLSSSSLSSDTRAGDCCAVGVRVPTAPNADVPYDDRIYVVGGRNGVNNPGAMVRYYSITRDVWQQVASMHVPRSHLGCEAAQPQHRPTIYAIAGGNSPLGLAMRSVESYDVLKDVWTLHDNLLPDGRTRIGVENVDDKFLALIGGDSACAGGGGAKCAGDDPLTAFDIIDIRAKLTLVSPKQFELPQLQLPRQTPGTAFRKGPQGLELYVIGGRTRDESGSLGVLTSTELLSISLQELDSL